MDQKKIVVKIDADIEELIPDYLKNRRSDVKSIEEAISKGDFESIRITGHSMKGSGGGYGFDGISEIGSAIEIAAKENNSGEIKKQNEKLASYLDRVEIKFQ